MKSIEPPNAFEQLVIARNCGVDDWVLPALSAMCERRPPLSLEEARQMDIEGVVLIATVREKNPWQRASDRYGWDTAPH